MDMNQAFPGAHFKASDLATSPITLTIASVAMGKVGEETKPLMKFYEAEQDLVLNKTNANTLIQVFGAESNAWAGKQVQLFATKVQFGAEMVDAVRITPVQAGAAPAPAGQPAAPVPPPAVAYGAVPQQPVPQQPVPQQPVPQQPVPPPAQVAVPPGAPAPAPVAPGQPTYPTTPPPGYDALS